MGHVVHMTDAFAHRNVVVKPDRKSYLEDLNVGGMIKLRESLVK